MEEQQNKVYILPEDVGTLVKKPRYLLTFEYVPASLLDEAVEALEEARKLATQANEALFVRVLARDIPNTVYNYERGHRRAYIDRIDATLAKIRSKTE